MRRIIDYNKKGEVIKDLSVVQLPHSLELSIFQMLNPNLRATIKGKTAC